MNNRKLLITKGDGQYLFGIVDDEQERYVGQINKDTQKYDLFEQHLNCDIRFHHELSIVDLINVAQLKNVKDLLESLTEIEIKNELGTELENELEPQVKNYQKAILTDIPLYGAVIRLYVDVTDNFIKSDLKESYPNSEEINQIESGYLLDMNERDIYGCVRFVESEFLAIVRIKTSPDILYMVGLLAHEALHITSKILRHGLKCDLEDNTEEIYCYLHDYIYAFLYDVIIQQSFKNNLKNH